MSKEEKTISVKIPRKDDDSCYDDIKVPFIKGMVAKDAVRAAYKIRGDPYPPDVEKEPELYMRLKGTGNVMDIIKASGETEVVIFEMDIDEDTFTSRIIRRLNVSIPPDLEIEVVEPEEKRIKRKE